MVFDAPHLQDQPYSHRLANLQQSTSYYTGIITNNMHKGIPSGHPVLQVVSPMRCENAQHLDAFFHEIRSRGGEGVILRNPKSWYFQKDSFLKKEVRWC
jgi:ATP-dependent DNA ligase